MGKLGTFEVGILSQEIGPVNSKLTDYRDIRKERKISKKNYNDPQGSNPNIDGLTNFLSSDNSGIIKDRKGAIGRMRGAMSLEQTNSNVFDRLLSQSTITSRKKEKPPVIQSEETGSNLSNYSRVRSGTGSGYAELQDLDDSMMKWNCDFSVEGAHLGPIYSIATMENQLYTSSKKSLKIWDIDTMDCISDIAAHQGVIKSL